MSGLFDSPLPNLLPCYCGKAGFCPLHGTYQPAVEDPEILDILSQSIASKAGRRVMRKQIGGE